MSLIFNGVEANKVMWNGADTTGYFNGNMVWGEPTSAVIFSSMNEISNWNLQIPINIEVPRNYKYLSVIFDWKYNTGGTGWAYNRTLKYNNFNTAASRYFRGHWRFPNGTLQPVVQAQNYASAYYNSTIGPSTTGSSATSTRQVWANSTTASTYDTINYTFSINGSGFYASVNGVLRYKDNQAQDIDYIYNFTTTNEVTASTYRRTFYTRNLQVAVFNDLNTASAWR